MSPKAGKDQYPGSKTNKESKLFFTPQLCSTQAFIGLDEAHLHCREKYALFSIIIQRLILSRPTKNKFY